MGSVRRAAIDVGTNSVKLLVADVGPGGVRPLLETSEQTRLGKGFYETHRLQADAIGHTASVVERFADQARAMDVTSLQIIATSAARDAVNPDDLIHAIHSRSGLAVRIITGDQEAELVFQGIITDPRLKNGRLLILDVGGGSTEFILGEKGHHSFRQSFAMGSVRLMEKLRPSDPPTLQDLARCRAWLIDYFDREVGPVLETWFRQPEDCPMQLVGTGGATTILARMELQMDGFDRDRIDGMRLSRGRITEYMTALWGISLEKRAKLPGLPSNRADIILMGVAIYEAVMTRCNLQDLYVSTRGLRFGLVQLDELKEPADRGIP